MSGGNQHSPYIGSNQVNFRFWPEAAFVSSCYW